MNMEEMVVEIRRHVQDNFPLADMTDEQLEDQIEELVQERAAELYLSLDEQVMIAQQVYSSIRGLGILDSIMMDDNITEVMINGPDNIFIEKGGRLQRSEYHYEDEKQLEDVIQRIVGMAGREVNESNPIVDTRLQDGSRVNVVLPPIALCGATMTI